MEVDLVISLMTSAADPTKIQSQIINLSAEEHQAGKYFVSNATKSLHNLTHFFFNFN